jgi:hypothetical protein
LFLAGCSGDGRPAATKSSDGYVVAGRLFDDNQLPVANASLALTQRKDNSPVASSNASENGEFSFGKVPIGTYVLTVKAPGFELFVRNLDVIDGRQEQLASITFTLAPLPIIEPFHLSVPKRLAIQYGLAYAINGDFNQGCMQPSYTCNGIAYPPNAFVTFDAIDPKQTPWMGAVFDEYWESTSPICAKAVAVDIYNPDAPGIQNPNQTNPHYWTNYPSKKWGISNPIRMVIPRNATGDTDAVDADWRVQSNGGKMLVRGNWTVRNFPPGKGVTNLLADVNCFTDQTFNLVWTNFYLTPAPADFTARPQ